MTNNEAIHLADGTLVQHKSGKFYKVCDVYTQQAITGVDLAGPYAPTPEKIAERGWVLVPTSSDRAASFIENPRKHATLGVVGQRHGQDFGPWRSLKASDCTVVEGGR